MKGVFNWKIFFVFVFLICCIILGLKIGIDIKYENDLSEIYSTRDTRLDNYYDNEALAKSYLQVYDIVDADSYKNIKNDMYDKFSYEMRNQIFPTVEYSGIDLHYMETEVIRVMGTNNGINQKNTFLLEYRLTGVNYDKVICNLIDIENGQITKVTKIN
jgi:hypothetical protein